MSSVTKSSLVNDWSFKDPDRKEEKNNQVYKKRSKNKNKKVIKRSKSHKSIEKSDDFYKSQEWLRLRYRVIKKYGGECMACGRSKKRHGVTIHVDHILPRSKFPRQALRFENLQILCDDCNLGKSNIDKTDWRPEMQVQGDAEMELVLSAIQFI